MKTIQDLAQKAIDCQGACNLSGVVHSFSSVMTELRVIARAEKWESTDRINRHPIAVMFSSKIADLTGSDRPIEIIEADRWCQEAITHR